MSIALALLGRLWPYLLGAALLVGGWLYLDRACWSSACKSAKAEATELRAEKAAAVERATALALLWADGLDKIDKAVKAAKDERDASFAALQDRARHSRGPSRVEPAASVRLQLDASRLANYPAAAGEREAAPAPVPASPVGDTEVSQAASDLAWALAAEAYADAVSQWRACVAAYEAIARP